MSFSQASTAYRQVCLVAPPIRQEYLGSTRKLVLAFDLGTTFGGISYSILEPGRVLPKIKIVTRYPSQESVGIPPVIYYDNEGNPCATSSLLYERVRLELEPFGISVSRPATHMNEVASNGAGSFYLDNLVPTSRVARATYGTTACTVFDINDPHHRQRWDRSILHPVTGEWVLQDIFAPILYKGTKVDAEQEFRQTFFKNVDPTVLLGKVVQIPVLVYSGRPTEPLWVYKNLDSISVLCTIEADISNVQPEWHESPAGTYYQTVRYDVVLLLGLTELKAQIAYFDVDGVERRGPAKVVYGVGL